MAVGLLIDYLCDFAAALRVAGKSVQLMEAPNYTHSAMCESLGHPYAPAGRRLGDYEPRAGVMLPRS